MFKVKSKQEIFQDEELRLQDFKASLIIFGVLGEINLKIEEQSPLEFNQLKKKNVGLVAQWIVHWTSR